MYVRWKFLNAGVCVFVVVVFVVVAPRSAGPKVSAAVPRAAIPKAACTVAGVMAMVCCFEWYGASQRPAWWASSVVARLVRCLFKCCAAGRALGRDARRDVNAANRSLWSSNGRLGRTGAALGRIQMPLPRRDLQLKRETPGCGLRRGWGFASHLATSDEDRQTRPRAGGGGVGARLASSVGRAHDS